MPDQTDAKLEKIVALCKRRGFVYQGSEIYGGFAGTWDYGPLGVELRRNVVEAWTKAMTREHENITMIDSSIFTSGKVWQASGHVSGFSDPLVICQGCHNKYRADHLLENIGAVADEKMAEAEINKLFDERRRDLVCPNCGQKNFGRVAAKNLLATATLGMFEESDEPVYLRGETAEGIYINYKNILDSGFYAVPFGVAQIGKVFRNEISPRQFLFRKREFEQMEMQYFVQPQAAPATYEEWKRERMSFYDRLGVAQTKLRWQQHEKMVFYARDAWDIQYEFPFGWNELEGVHYRGDYDLTQHQKFSGVDLSVLDEKTGQRFIPHIVETSVGLDRLILMLLADAYDEDEMGGEKRVVLKLAPNMAPVKAAIFPLLRNKPALVDKAREVYRQIKQTETRLIMFDDNGNIGKRYRRQDEIGTPYCVTIDFQTFEDDTVTVRARDTGEQERVKIVELLTHLN